MGSEWSLVFAAIATSLTLTGSAATQTTDGEAAALAVIEG